MKKYGCFHVYIMVSNSGTLYIGMTNDLLRRVHKHKQGKIDGFTKKYSCKKLVYFEKYKYVYGAISKEKQLKKWNRTKKEKWKKYINHNGNRKWNF